VAYLLIAFLAVVIFLVLSLVVKRRKTRQSTTPRTYGGPIRFTDPSGRNMKIIQKDDGTFEKVEE
jgi:hypothetical protein